MTAIRPGSNMQRDIKIPDIDKPIVVEITNVGLSFWIKGHRKKVRVTWTATIRAGNTPEDVPSFLMGNCLGLLKHQAEKKM